MVRRCNVAPSARRNGVAFIGSAAAVYVLLLLLGRLERDAVEAFTATGTINPASLLSPSHSQFHRLTTFATQPAITNHVKATLLGMSSDGNPPPFDSYYNSAASTATTPTPTPTTASFPTPVAPAAAAAPSYASSAVGNDNDPIATLARSQEQSVQQLRTAIADLVDKPSLSWTPDANRILTASSSASAMPTTIEAYDAPGSSNIAWLASVHVPNVLSSLTIFTGPLTSVPHIVSRCSFDATLSSMLEVAVDIRPRAYGAYELYNAATQSYPGPDELGRKAFEYAAARNEYTTRFATPNIAALLNVQQFEQATDLSPQQTELDRLTSGPLALWVTMPATAKNVQRIVSLRQAIVTAYTAWATEPTGLHQHRPGAPVNTQYVYDSKFRQNAYLSLVPIYQRLLKDTADGLTLAAAESGPLDEGYVGGGS